MKKLLIFAFIILLTKTGVCQIEQFDMQELLTLTNQQRLKYGKKATKKKPGIETLVWNETLAAAARVQADFLYKKRKLTHTGAFGSSVASRVKKLGYQWSSVGENLAKGQKSIPEVIKAWMQSPGHRRNILDIGFKEFGAAVLMGKDGQLIWVQVFGAKK